MKLSEKDLQKARQKEIKGADFLEGCGTVWELDLTNHEVFGDLQILLDQTDVRIILESVFKQLPENEKDNQATRKALLDRLYPFVKKTRIRIMMKPILNKRVLQEEKMYKI